MDDLTDAQIEAMADKCPGITRHSYILGAKDARAALSTSPAPTQATQDAEQAAMYRHVRDVIGLPHSITRGAHDMPGANWEAKLDAKRIVDLVATERASARALALEDAATAIAQHDRKGREWIPTSLWATLSNEAAARVRALANPIPTGDTP